MPKVLKDYFKELEEESIKDNFVITYELLDEMMDNGYPQTTEVPSALSSRWLVSGQLGNFCPLFTPLSGQLHVGKPRKSGM